MKLNDKVGKSLYNYARSLGTVYLVGNGHKHPGSLAQKIKRISKKVGLPHVSMHVTSIAARASITALI